jgi:hypothetical protein
MKYEYCCKCGDKTGKAGAGDDSLYTEHGGPFCEDCFPDAQHKQEQGEPVAIVVGDAWNSSIRFLPEGLDLPIDTPLYTTPQQRKPLTDKQIMDALNLKSCESYRVIVRAIEAAHGIKE